MGPTIRTVGFDQKSYMREYRKSYMPAYRAANLDYFRDLDRRRNARLRADAMTRLGGPICSSCGEDELEFLTIEHKFGGGRQHRIRVHSRGVCADIVAGRVDASSFCVLCRNCNSGSNVDAVLQTASVSRYARTGDPCGKCGLPKVERVSAHPKYGSRKRSGCPDCQRAAHAQLRSEAFGIIGRACSCCSEDQSSRLTVDVIHGDGSSARLKDRCGTSVFYKKIVSGALDLSLYQTLCWNCNYSKYVGGGVCIHKRKEVEK